MNYLPKKKRIITHRTKLSFLFLFCLISLIFFSRGVDAATLQKPPTNLGLVAYWSLDDATSTVVSDFSGNNNNGTTSNIAAPSTATSGWTNGKRGGALQFDGTNDRVSIPDVSDFTLGNTATFSMWVKIRTLNGNHRSFIAKRDNANDEYQVGLNTSNKFKLTLVTSGSACPCVDQTEDTTTLQTNTWYHLAVSFDDTTNTVKWYINGTTTETDTGVAQHFGGNSNVGVSLGSNFSGTPEFFAGTLDDVRVYNRVLSDAEVKSIYSSGQLTRPSPNETGLISYWPFNEATSTSVTDFSNSGNTGNLSASTGWTNAGKFGPGVTFGETVQMTTTNQYSNPTVFSISAWFNSTNPSGKKIIGFESNQTGNSSTNYDRHLYLGSDGKVYFGWFPGSVSTVSSSATYTDGIWHHVVGTHDGTTGTLYVDGVLQGSSSSGAPQSYSGFWRIGGRKLTTWTNGTDGNFIGKIDDVRIYNKTLSASEVSSLFKGSKTRFVNSSQATRLRDGLVGLWTFDGRDVDWGKNIIYDRSGNNLYGTTTGLSTTTTPVSGKVGQAFQFWNTTNNYIDLGNNALLAPTSAMTVSAWINTNDCNSTRYIMGKGDVASYYFRIQAVTCKLRLQIVTSGATNLDSSDNAIQNNTWHHVAGTWDGSNMRLYVDGSLVAGPTAKTGTLATPGTNVQIASTSAQPSFNGSLDEIRLYNRALGASEIKQLYLMGK